jgi:hypothetical protein
MPYETAETRAEKQDFASVDNANDKISSEICLRKHSTEAVLHDIICIYNGCIEQTRSAQLLLEVLTC